MKRASLWCCLILAGWLAIFGEAGAVDAKPKLRLSAKQVHQGDCFFVYLEGAGRGALPEINWAEKKGPMFWEGAGLALSKGGGAWGKVLPVWVETEPGLHEVLVTWKGSDGKERKAVANITVKSRMFGKQHLLLPPEQEELYTYPGVKKEYRLIREALSRSSPTARWEGKFIVPLASKKQTTTFGLSRYRRNKKQGVHKGIDYGAPKGTPVHAASSGVVALVQEEFRLHGKTIIIDHGRGVCTLYLHLSKISVKPGQEVKQGELIGRVGDSGVATGPHLHYALYVADTAVDPAWWEKQAR